MTIDEWNTKINNYLSGHASPEEIKCVDEWYDSFDAAAGFTEQFSKEINSQYLENSFLSVKEKIGL